MFRNIQARLGVIKGSKYHPCFNIKAERECKGVVFFMHGLGDNGMGWTEGFASQAHPNLRYVFPSANHMPVSLNLGMEMPSWFDIKELSENIEDRYDMGTKKNLGFTGPSPFPLFLTYDKSTGFYLLG